MYIVLEVDPHMILMCKSFECEIIEGTIASVNAKTKHQGTVK